MRLKYIFTAIFLMISLSSMAQTWSNFNNFGVQVSSTGKVRFLPTSGSGNSPIALSDSLKTKANTATTNTFAGIQTFSTGVNFGFVPNESTGRAFALIRDSLSGEIKQIKATSQLYPGKLRVVISDTAGIIWAKKFKDSDFSVRSDGSLSSLIGVDNTGSGLHYKWSPASVGSYLSSIMNLQTISTNGATTDKNLNIYRTGASFINFKNTSLPTTSQVQIGMLGNPEANLSFNMDYTTQVHKYFDSSINAAWLAISPNNYALQFSPSGSSTAGDMWNDTGNQYAFWGEFPSFRFAINTNLTDTKGDAQFWVKRKLNTVAALSGFTDLVIEGHRQSGQSGLITLNSLSSGNVILAGGGGKVGLGGTTNPSNVVDVKVPTSTGSGTADGFSVNDGAASRLGINLGVNTASSYAWIQVAKSGIGAQIMSINPGGGKVLVGSATDSNTGNFQVTGNASGTLAATTSTQYMRKGEVDAADALKQNITTTNNSLTTAQTSSTLNSSYPSALVGDQVMAPNVGTGMLYIKVSTTSGGQWRAFSGSSI